MTGDGNGWTWCALGHRHWGLYGAAGILITDGHRVILQHRAAWTHEGGTWSVPGGARDSHEDAVTTALREATEETTLDSEAVQPGPQWTDEHGGWSYTTIVARGRQELQLSPSNAESVALGWWTIEAVGSLSLHRGFAAAWPHLQALINSV